MTHYIHPELPGFVSPAPFVLGEIHYPRVWWATADEGKIDSLGFVAHSAPIQSDIVSNILSAPRIGFGGQNGKELFHGYR